MTLVELLVAIAAMGLIATVAAAAVGTTLRQDANTRGRVDVARWEQNLVSWMPTDLSSASTADIAPTASPCGAPSCPGVGALGGSNALTLTWDEDGATTTVSYIYRPASSGDGFELVRIECRAGTCSSIRVLGDLSAPMNPDGTPMPWSPGSPIPAGVIAVSAPSGSGTGDPTDIVVSVNGLPTIDGVDRSSRVALNFGGSPTDTLPIPVFQPPGYSPAHSDCGGPITLIVDESGSIGGDIANVRSGVQEFVDAFEGTPVRLQVVELYSTSSALGSGGAWNKYFDMSEPSDVTALTTAITSIAVRPNTSFYTNWEDALFRTFKSSSGALHVTDGDDDPDPMPELVVFFTDGLPTRSRATDKSDSASATMTVPAPFNANAPSSKSYDNSLDMVMREFDLHGFWRAQQQIEEAGVRVIGLGVGDAFGVSRRMRRADGSSWATGWPHVYIPHERFLGDVVSAGNPSLTTGPAYVKRTWSAGTGWGDLTGVDLLVSTDFTKFASALTAIALDQCGASLTVQSRDNVSHTPVNFDVTYLVEGTTVTTSQLQKSGTFDINLAGQPDKVVSLVPQAVGSATATAANWQCRAGGAALPAGDVELINPSDPGQGINVRVSANSATSCTLYFS